MSIAAVGRVGVCTERSIVPRQRALCLPVDFNTFTGILHRPDGYKSAGSEGGSEICSDECSASSSDTRRANALPAQFAAPYIQPSYIGED